MTHRLRPRRAGLLALLCGAFAAPAGAAGDLTQLSLEQLLQVRVVGASKYEQSASEVAAAVSVITRAEIKAFGWRTLEAALASLPGIHTTYDRQYTYLGTRGFGLPGDFNTRVLVTINGNRVNDNVFDAGPMGGQLPLDLALVERIEFIPGPGGAVHGQNAMFGVVNVVTRDGAGLAGSELAASWQAPQRLGEMRASWGARLAGGVDVLLSASRLSARGEDRAYDFGSAGVSGIAAGLDGERDRELFARVAGGSWSFDLVFGDRRKDDPSGAYFSDPLVPGQYQRDRTLLAQGRYETRLADDRLQLLARLFAGRMDYASTLSYGTPFGFPAQGRWHGAELRLLWTGLADHKLMLGAEAQRDARVEQQVIDRANPANDIRIAGAGSRSGLYLQDEWRLGATLSSTLGLRFDRDHWGGTHSSPRAALIWQATPATTWKALAGRAHRAPNAYERDYDDGLALVGNPALRGESIDTFEIVADQRTGAGVALRASAYEWRMRNVVTLVDLNSHLSQYQSGAPVRARGLELSADKTWASTLRLRANVSLQRATQQGSGELVNAPQRLAKFSLSAPLPWAGLQAGYELRYDSGRLSLDGSRLGGYALSNLHLATSALAPGLELSLGIANIFDKRYAHPGADTNWQNALEQDGRSVRLALDLRF